MQDQGFSPQDTWRWNTEHSRPCCTTSNHWAKWHMLRRFSRKVLHRDAWAWPTFVPQIAWPRTVKYTHTSDKRRAHALDTEQQLRSTSSRPVTIFQTRQTTMQKATIYHQICAPPYVAVMEIFHLNFFNLRTFPIVRLQVSWKLQPHWYICQLKFIRVFHISRALCISLLIPGRV
jgi:hypothetical protein